MDNNYIIGQKKITMKGHGWDFIVKRPIRNRIFFKYTTNLSEITFMWKKTTICKYLKKMLDFFKIKKTFDPDLNRNKRILDKLCLQLHPVNINHYPSLR